MGGKVKANAGRTKNQEVNKVDNFVGANAGKGEALRAETDGGGGG
jgi:hypothetical protein